jgi:hypothetical protein
VEERSQILTTGNPNFSGILMRRIFPAVLFSGGITFIWKLKDFLPDFIKIPDAFDKEIA